MYAVNELNIKLFDDMLSTWLDFVAQANSFGEDDTSLYTSPGTCSEVLQLNKAALQLFEDWCDRRGIQTVKYSYEIDANSDNSTRRYGNCVCAIIEDVDLHVYWSSVVMVYPSELVEPVGQIPLHI